MKMLLRIFAIGLIIAINGCSKTDESPPSKADSPSEREDIVAPTEGFEIPTQLPDPPAGFKWVLNAPYSDEFEGTGLDTDKWHDHYPNWEGRVPGKFVPSSISLQDGFLQIRCTVLDPPQDDFTIACGAVQTKAQEARYGYYECRMKASNISTSSTFWLKNISGGHQRPYKATELDIQECIGNAQRWENFADHMNGNTHLTVFSADKTEESLNAKKGDRYKMKTRASEAFHTYGCWWIDANTMNFYCDGEEAFTITPSTEFDETPFDQPMFVNLVCETYAWEVAPTTEELMDDSRNTTYYDYVRAYKLEPEK